MKFLKFFWNQIKNVFCVKILYEKVPFTFFALICQFQLIYSERTPIDQSVHVVPIDEQIDIRIGAPCGPDRPASLEKVEASDRRQDYDALSGRKRFYKASHQKVEAFRSTLRLSEASLQKVEALH